ncbi:BRO family protein [Sphingomonas sp. BK235]|uniref:BRO-N domain-containing protein n=1 Tax=Sphingomonas sp. BK235 TaxID=2512131 RepID=UPI0010480DF9|nr:BRO family protein [Sphingomonas sp. BK235]TCP35919.1 BRO family protein [Sphingomonas sp. BK235]
MEPVLTYQFEDEPVRVITVAGDPWFVAGDIAKALGYRDATAMTRNLQDDERGTHVLCTPSADQEMTIISESGMYAAIFKSRRPEADRFRRWVTGEVLPSIRKTGRYELPGYDPRPLAPGDVDPVRLNASVATVREARRLFGPAAARSLWTQLGLPAPIVDACPLIEGDNLAEPLKEWLAERTETTALLAAQGIGLETVDRGVLYRTGALLRLFGWVDWPVKREGVKRNMWFHPDHVPQLVREARAARGL